MTAPFGWQEGRLGDFITLQRGYDLPEYDRKQGAVPVVTSSGVSGSHDTARAVGPGVVMGRYGTIGQLYYVEQDFWPHNTTLFVTDFRGSHPHFIYYFLQTLDYSAHSDKTSVPGINRNHLYTLPVALPPLAEQRAIAGILGALDDKIALNRQMNATLEGMARALFQSWFVDFDPVRAKAEGRAPVGMDAETAALFPASFEDSALGKVPKGWGVRTIGDVAEFAYGKALKSEDRNPGDVPVYGSNGQVGWHDASLSGPAGIIVGRKGNPGTVNWSQVPFFAIDTTFYVVMRDADIPLEYMYFVLAQQDLASLSADSAVPGLNRNLAYGNTTLVPPQELAREFVMHIRPIFARIDVNERESRTLAETRDALLPKLVSGALRVG